MSQNRAHLDKGGNDVRKQGPGDMMMDQKKPYALTTVGAGTILAEMILSGIIDRTGPTAGYIDTWPTAQQILAACPELDTGDSFEFLFINGVAFANTSAAPDASVTLVNGSVTASLIKRFLLTVLADGVPTIAPVTTLNGNAVLTGLTAAQIKGIQPGMGVSGTGIQAGSVVIGVQGPSGAAGSTGSVTLSLTANASGLNAATFFPRVQIRGLYQAAA